MTPKQRADALVEAMIRAEGSGTYDGEDFCVFVRGALHPLAVSMLDDHVAQEVRVATALRTFVDRIALGPVNLEDAIREARTLRKAIASLLDEPAP